MPIVQLRDGTWARTEGEPSPQEKRHLGVRVSAPTTKAPAVDPVDAEARRRVAARDKAAPFSKYGAADKFTHEYTLHADEVVGPAASALLRGGYNAIRKGDVGEIGKEYKVARREAQMRRQDYENKGSWGGNVMGLAGAVINPLGAETGASKLLTRFAPGVAKAAKANKIIQAIGKAGNTAIGQGARAGFNQAAATSLLDTGDTGAATRSGLLGMATGGTLSAFGKAGGAVVKAFKDRAPNAAERVAYAKVSDMLGRTRRPGNTHMPYTPEAAVREMQTAARAGHDPMLMDLSPEMRNTGGWLARKPNLKAANALVDAGEIRASGAADRFDTEVGKRINTPTGDNAYKLKGDITSRRKGKAQIDYAEGGAMDTPIEWSAKLDKFFKESPDADRLIQKAYTDAKRFGEDLVGSVQHANGVTQYVPTMRVFDRLKKAFDGEIGTAMKSGDNTLAAGLSEHLKQLKGLIADANPQYADILASQRDEFEKFASAELGQSLFKRMKSREGAQQLLEEMKAGKTQTNELRSGVADALLSMRNTSDNPVAVMRRFMRSKEQRAVLEHIMGGTKELNKFDRFIRREIRGGKTDAMLGKQSATNIFQQVGEADAGESIGYMLNNTLRGGAFGGPAGAVSAGVRTVDQLRRGMGAHAREELAKILMGRGEGLVQGIKDAQSHTQAYKKFEEDLARALAKAGAYSVSGINAE